MADPSVGRWQRCTDMPPVVVMLSSTRPWAASQSMAAAEPSHIVVTRSTLPQLLPPTSVSLMNRSVESSMPCSFW